MTEDHGVGGSTPPIPILKVSPQGVSQKDDLCEASTPPHSHLKTFINRV